MATRNNPQCPQCVEGRLVTRTSRRLDRLIERDRKCNAGCGYGDTVLVQPAVVVKVLCTHQLTPHEPGDTP